MSRTSGGTRPAGSSAPAVSPSEAPRIPPALASHPASPSNVTSGSSVRSTIVHTRLTPARAARARAPPGSASMSRCAWVSAVGAPSRGRTTVLPDPGNVGMRSRASGIPLLGVLLDAGEERLALLHARTDRQPAPRAGDEGVRDLVRVAKAEPLPHLARGVRQYRGGDE